MIFTILAVCSALEINYIPKSKDIPRNRVYTTLSYNEQEEKLVLFGGRLDDQNLSNEVWLYSIPDKEWSFEYPSNTDVPVARYFHGMFDLKSTSETCIFGGINYYGIFKDIWCFNLYSASWQRISPNGDKISPRFSFGYTTYIDSNDDQIFAIYGGKTRNDYLDELCLLNTSNWTWTVYKNLDPSPGKRKDSLIEYYQNYLYLASGNFEEEKYVDFFRFSTDSFIWENISQNQTYRPVQFAGSFIYENEFYLIFGLSLETTDGKIYKSNLLGNFEWEIISEFDEIKAHGFGYARVETSFYIFGGYDLEIINRFSKINLDTKSIEFEIIGTEYSPALRVQHSLETINDHLFLFGGDSQLEKLNDLWKFYPKSEMWEKINYNGKAPSPRSHHASASYGDSLLIWGGQNTLGYLNDMFKYIKTTNTWEEMTTVSPNKPAGRISACVVLESPLLYVFGGKSVAGLQSDLWVYDISSQEYTLIDDSNEIGPGGMKNMKCAIENKDDQKVFHIMYGTGGSEEALGTIHTFNLSTRTWKQIHKSDNPRNSSLVMKIGDKVLIGGGERWGIYPHKDIFLIDLTDCTEKSCNETKIGDLNDFFLSGGFTYIGNHVYLHGGSNPVDEIIRSNVPKNIFYRFDIFEICPECNCSLGSEIIDNQCDLCKPGHYSEEFGIACQACEAGFFNEEVGANSLKQCYPCQTGYFNPYEGASYCLECPLLTDCSIGSSSYSVNLIETEMGSDQPVLYENKTSQANTISYILIASTTVIGAVVIFLFLCVSTLNSKLEAIDIFSSNHVHQTGKPLQLIRNKLGGVFALIFLAVALTIPMSTIPTYFVDNTTETKSLVPYVILMDDYSFESEMIVSLLMRSYYAPCIKTEDLCDDTIFFTTEFVEFSEKIQQNCYRRSDDCEVVLRCTGCSVNSHGFIEITLSHSISYAWGITANVTTFSSIPNEYSSTMQSVSAESDTVFRGHPSTRFYFTLIPSLYQSLFTVEEFSGYHSIITSLPTPGASHKVSEVQFTGSLSVKIELLVSENSLITLRMERYTLFYLFISILGSITGALSFFRVAMAFSEKFKIKVENKLNEKIWKRKVREKRVDLKTMISNIPNRQDSDSFEKSVIDYTKVHIDKNEHDIGLMD